MYFNYMYNTFVVCISIFASSYSILAIVSIKLPFQTITTGGRFFTDETTW